MTIYSLNQNYKLYVDLIKNTYVKYDINCIKNGVEYVIIPLQ